MSFVTHVVVLVAISRRLSSEATSDSTVAQDNGESDSESLGHRDCLTAKDQLTTAT